MAEFVANAVQVVEPNQNVLLMDSIPCPHGYVIHRNGSGIITLRGIVNNSCGCFARYMVTFNGNIAVPENGEAGPIAVALAIDGEPLQTSRAIVTPADVAEAPPSTNNYFNVTSTAIITVPKGCCYTVSVENVSVSDDPATTPPPEINVQNANLVVSRIA